MDKLNFTNIVQKQLEAKELSENVNSRWNKALIDTTKTHKENTNNIQYKMDSIVAYVHTKLQERSAAQKQTAKPLRIMPLQTTMRKVEKTPAGNVIIDNPYSVPKKPKKCAKTSECDIKNIPRIKALCEEKEKKRINRNIPPPRDKNNFTNQQRFEEAKRQHALYENLIEDQKQLRLDRQSIAAEIYTMRNCLDDIRGRLDYSLKKLDDNKTYSALNNLKADNKKPTKLKTAFKTKRQFKTTAAKK